MRIFKAAFFSLLISTLLVNLVNTANSNSADSEGAFLNKSLLPEKPIVVIIPSYNNLNYYKKNIDSVLMQNYENYIVLYIDDCSNDGMSDVVPAYIDKHDTVGRWFYVRNWHNCGAMSNWYYAIHECPDEAIIVNLDGDDWLKHENVLARINEEYADENVWLTYGQFEWLNGARGFCCAPAPETLNDPLCRVRWHCMQVSHLRTFYAWLFKKIQVTDLLYKGEFFPVACDWAMMAPMLEMATHDHSRYIDEVLYVYNNASPLNDHAVRAQLQWELGGHVMSMPSYQPLDMQNFSEQFIPLQSIESVVN